MNEIDSIAEYDTPIIYSHDSKCALKSITDLHYEINNPYNDGFTSSIMKRRLIQIKESVDKALTDAPVFADQ